MNNKLNYSCCKIVCSEVVGKIVIKYSDCFNKEGLNMEKTNVFCVKCNKIITKKEAISVVTDTRWKPTGQVVNGLPHGIMISENMVYVCNSCYEEFKNK